MALHRTFIHHPTSHVHLHYVVTTTFTLPTTSKNNDYKFQAFSTYACHCNCKNIKLVMYIRRPLIVLACVMCVRDQSNQCHLCSLAYLSHATLIAHAITPCHMTLSHVTRHHTASHDALTCYTPSLCLHRETTIWR